MTRYICTLCLLPGLLASSCSTPFARQWESRLWITQQQTDGDVQNPSNNSWLDTDDLRFNVVCTQFRQVQNFRYSVLAIGVQCRNESSMTYPMEFNPIQVLTESDVIVQPMLLDHVMYKFYGGDLRTAAQIAQASQPYESYPCTPAGDILAGIINLYRAYENQAVVTEFARKEALPHDLYYNSFVPTSAPPGGAVQWIQYYPETLKPIKIMIEGTTLESAVTFENPPPAPPPKPMRTADQAELGTILVAMAVIGFLILNEYASKIVYSLRSTSTANMSRF